MLEFLNSEILKATTKEAAKHIIVYLTIAIVLQHVILYKHLRHTTQDATHARQPLKSQNLQPISQTSAPSVLIYVTHF